MKPIHSLSLSLIGKVHSNSYAIPDMLARKRPIVRPCGRAVSKSHQPPLDVTTSVPTMRTLEEEKFFGMANPALPFILGCLLSTVQHSRFGSKRTG